MPIDVVCSGRILGWASAVIISGSLLSGCNRPPAARDPIENKNVVASTRPQIHIPLPDRALLKSPSKPDCKFRDTNADVQQILEYEKNCYRLSEIIVRNRLERLQRSVKRTISAFEEANGDDEPRASF